jgi:transposase
VRDGASLGREIQRLGHRVRLMLPRDVKAYVKIQKNDAADAEAICEAVTRPTMRFVELKTSEQQSILILHRTRQLFVRQRITLIKCDPGPSGGVWDCDAGRPQRRGEAAADHW